MKIGILTFHRANNYGAFLQSYGLCSRLNQEKDIEAEIIDFHMNKEINLFDESKKSFLFKILRYPTYKFLKIRRNTFEKSLKYHKLSKNYLHSDNIDEFINFVKDKYDIIIVGSDEVWKVDGYRGFPNPYWLPSDLGCIKCSYAVSSRTNLESYSVEKIEKLQNLLKDFKIISVRDEITYEQFRKILPCDKKIYINADPSFIFDYKINKKNGKRILMNKIKLRNNKKIAIVMLDNGKVSRLIKKQLEKEYHLVSVFWRHNGYVNIADLSPFEWIDIIASADLVISSFFHGICFSIVTETPFLAIGTCYQKSSKLIDIINKTNNKDSYISLKDLKNNKFLLKKKCLKLNKPNGKEYIEKSRKDFKKYLDMIRSF